MADPVKRAAAHFLSETNVGDLPLPSESSGPGLLKISLQKNHFSPKDESYRKIVEMLRSRDPLLKCKYAMSDVKITHDHIL